VQDEDTISILNNFFFWNN